MTQFSSFLPDVQSIATNAGKVTLPFFQNSSTKVAHKDDGSPVTKADQASEDIIIPALKSLIPDIPVIAEEQAEAGKAPDVRQADTFWLVDPLDGTKEFIKGSPDYTVNIGLIHKGMPVMGVVYIPATGDMYHGGVDIGAFFNGQPIKANSSPNWMNLSVIASKSSPVKSARDAFLARNELGIGTYVMRGSSLKFCLIADGQADLYPRFVPTYEWDTAAAHAILLQAGGDIIDFQTKQRLEYGKYDDNYLNGYLVTASNPVLQKLAI
jgi:3'(2'), 5'-bisphosphate nucleotidase